MMVEIFDTPPSDFSPQMAVASCCCEYQGRILLLKRHPEKFEGNCWNLPGGKMEPGEKPHDAALRELAEESGIIPENSLQLIGCLYIRRPGIDYPFHMFFLLCSHQPTLQLATQESTEACWVNFQEAKSLPLMSGGGAILDFFYSWREKHFSTIL